MSITSPYSERIIEELKARSAERKIGIFEAAGEYCEENDMDEAEFISQLDKNAVEQLKIAAMDEGRVRKCVAGVNNNLW